MTTPGGAAAPDKARVVIRTDPVLSLMFGGLGLAFLAAGAFFWGAGFAGGLLLAGGVLVPIALVFHFRTVAVLEPDHVRIGRFKAAYADIAEVGSRSIMGQTGAGLQKRDFVMIRFHGEPEGGYTFLPPIKGGAERLAGMIRERLSARGDDPAA